MQGVGVKVGGWDTHMHEIVKEQSWLIKNKCLNIILEQLIKIFQNGIH